IGAGSGPTFTPLSVVHTYAFAFGTPVASYLIPSKQGVPAKPPPARVQAHLTQLGPPQSMSVSPSFWTPSVQVAAWHTPPVQIVLSQSEPARHDLPAVHAVQVGPPQSTSVSLAFLTPSVQVGAWHTPPVHTRLVQSCAPVTQPFPSGHGAQVPPPQ